MRFPTTLEWRAKNVPAAGRTLISLCFLLSQWTAPSHSSAWPMAGDVKGEPTFFQGSLLVFGGHDGSNFVRSAESFTPSSDRCVLCCVCGSYFLAFAPMCPEQDFLAQVERGRGNAGSARSFRFVCLQRQSACPFLCAREYGTVPQDARLMARRCRCGRWVGGIRTAATGCSAR